MNTYPLRKAQSGISLLESLIAILIFSVGILAVVALQAAAIKGTTEAKLRADAAYLANQIVARMWVSDRVNAASANFIGNFAHLPAGAACAPGGAASANGFVTSWLSEVAATLPGATAATQQIIVGANNLVTVSLCWQIGTDQRQLSVTAQLNG
jgi:type IV pilus assembly protein PilV